ncbi:MAG: ribose 5-phosphate isomerase A [Mucilaginibacter sp.]|uniref:ribose 5-phosphate isomerase A n=1 Tax=Mucilaginibacter sp. L3T2-6 TaxID=3062491 RepID=UPI002674AB7C|nr:ribose 5-phosphate isomerase A [Mucilaginibacter sp. L3T2-6]MDO3643583.1 ribose 5-phosphate isomerase A [Mucilaginibacter sp. L3T2-6]MDV6216034.1 ribose 5-phosphate isomerase A [Mucilaginibacter sp. L3T2-6]
MNWNSNLINNLHWSDTIINKEGKEKVAAKIAEKVKDGDVLGVGSGSTVFMALFAIARRVKEEGLNVKAIPTSVEISMALTNLGIPMTSLYEHRPDWLFDGADEVDPNRSLIKGRGGAMFKEKLLISSSPVNFIIVDDSKLVDKLGSKFPVPIEVFPQALLHAEKELQKLGVRELILRPAKGKDGPVITEAGNVILDAWFDDIPADTELRIKSITGVIESGLFINYNVEIMVA